MNRIILGSPPPAMAYLLSVTFSMPLRRCQILFQDYASVAAVVEPNAKSDTNKTKVNLNKMFWSKPRSLALAADSPYRIHDPQYEGVKRFMLKLMIFYSKQSQFIRSANAIYSRVLYQVDRPAIYDGMCF